MNLTAFYEVIHKNVFEQKHLIIDKRALSAKSIINKYSLKEKRG
jgi:hypothetical protein